MKESVTYQAIVEEGKVEGKVEGRQEDIVRLGGKRFGPPSTAVQTALRSIQDVNHLARIHDRLLDASSWDDLLATP